MINFKALALCLTFGMLVVLVDFSDSSPLLVWVGNLDHIFGSRLWYATEAIYLLASIATFLLFGKVCLDQGRQERKDQVLRQYFH